MSRAGRDLMRLSSVWRSSARLQATRRRVRTERCPSSNEKCLETRARREAIASAFAFAAGGKRTNALRISALAAYREARETSSPRSSGCRARGEPTAAAAFLHPLARAHQVKHVLGAAAPGVTRKRARPLAESMARMGGDHGRIRIAAGRVLAVAWSPVATAQPA